MLNLSQRYYQIKLTTFSEFILSNNTDFSRKIVQNKISTKRIVQNFFSGSHYLSNNTETFIHKVTIKHAFLESILINTDIFRQLPTNYTNLFRVHSKPYQHLQRVTAKQW